MNADEGVTPPARQTRGSCGYDFHMPYDVDLVPGEWTMIDTGVRLTAEDHVFNVTTHFYDGSCIHHDWPGPWFMMVVPRSGLGTKYGFRMRNTVGIIDQDYRDNIMACVTVDKPLHLKKGDRFMQGILMPYLIMVGEATPVKERTGGHGSTDM